MIGVFVRYIYMFFVCSLNYTVNWSDKLTRSIEHRWWSNRKMILVFRQMYKSVFLFVKEAKFHYKWCTYIKIRWMDSPSAGDRFNGSIVQCVWSSAFSKITTVHLVPSFWWSVAMTIRLHFMTMHVLYQPCSRSLNDLPLTGHDVSKTLPKTARHSRTLLVILNSSKQRLLAKLNDLSAPSKIHSRLFLTTIRLHKTTKVSIGWRLGRMGI